MSAKKAKKKLRLTIEIDDVWADDLDECAEIMQDALDGYSLDEARLDVVVNEWFNERCFIVLTTIPGEKCQNSEFDHIGREARIVGAEAK